MASYNNCNFYNLLQLLRCLAKLAFIIIKQLSSLKSKLYEIP